MNDGIAIIPPGGTALGPPAALVDRARQYADAAQSANTTRAYQGAFKRWCVWCTQVGYAPLPAEAEAVALYLTRLADEGKAWATMNTALAAIEYYQKTNGHVPVRTSLPVTLVGRGIRRTHGTAQKQAQPITVEQLRRICEASETADGWHATRNRAMMLLGFSGAFRRSELVGLNIGDLRRDDEHGYVATLRHSKTDQEGEGFIKGIPFGGRKTTCPVRSLDAWLRVYPESQMHPASPLFVKESGYRLDSWSVNHIVKAALQSVGVDAGPYSAHSLRAGFVTAAARADKRLDQIMKQTGHKSVEVAMRYIRVVDLFRDNPADGLGL